MRGNYYSWCRDALKPSAKFIVETCESMILSSRYIKVSTITIVGAVQPRGLKAREFVVKWSRQRLFFRLDTLAQALSAGYDHVGHSGSVN